MLVFRYDKTFDGLLTAVFDAYSRKTFPDKLLGPDDIAPLFAQEIHTVVTDNEKSGRVWASLQKKLSKIACNMITYAWLSEQPESDELIFRFIRKNFDNKQSVEMNFADPDVLELHQLAKKVSHERHYLMQFVRFQKTTDDLFFAAVEPFYNALPLALDYFVDRFSYQKWILYDTKRKYGYYFDTKQVTEMTFDTELNFPGGKLDEKVMAEDEKLFQDMWRGYFKSISIKERTNLKLQRQHMPKRFWKYLTEKQ